MKPRYIALFAAALAVVIAAGCANRPQLVLPTIKPYKMDIQQGNVVTQDMIDKVKLGMNRSQVRFALGTPLIADPFHPERWDYVYLYQKAGVVTEHRRIVAIFKDDLLVRIDGDVVPASAPGAPAETKAKPVATPIKPEPAAPKPTASAPSSSGGGTPVADPAPSTSTGSQPAGTRP